MEIDTYIQNWHDLQNKVSNMEARLFGSLLLEKEIFTVGITKLMSKVEGKKYVMGSANTTMSNPSKEAVTISYYFVMLPNSSNEKDTTIKNLKDLGNLDDLLLLYNEKDDDYTTYRYLIYDFTYRKYKMPDFIYNFCTKNKKSLYYPSLSEINVLTDDSWSYDFGTFDYVKSFINYLTEYQFKNGIITSNEEMDKCIDEFIAVKMNKPKTKQKIK